VGELRCWLEGDAPRVNCPEHGPTVVQVPWARHGAGHTRAFDDQVAWLAVHTSKTAVCELMRVAWRTVGAIVTRVVADARAAVDPFDGLVRIGIDEISYKRGHRYLTIVADHDSGRLIWAAPGRDKKTLEGFFDLLGDQRAAKLKVISADAAEWIQTVVETRAPNAVLCMDAFHVVMLSRGRPTRSTSCAAATPGTPHAEPVRPPCPRTQARPVRNLEEPRGSHLATTTQTRLDSQGQPAAVPRLPAQRTAPGRIAAVAVARKIITLTFSALRDGEVRCLQRAA
jgi:hypothetical protein